MSERTTPEYIVGYLQELLPKLWSVAVLDSSDQVVAGDRSIQTLGRDLVCKGMGVGMLEIDLDDGSKVFLATGIRYKVLVVDGGNSLSALVHHDLHLALRALETEV